jgi:2-(1,2-epoxy-1,2-dihydrophenyl)acetyl-CoA isomerase
MSSIKLQVASGGLVAKVTLNRPDRYNAFDREMLRELGDMIRGVAESDKVRMLVLTGEGKAFCAGADLHAAKASDSVSNYLGSVAKAFHSVLETLASVPAVVVTLVNGPAAGGGFALAMAGDLRLGVPEAKLRLGYGRVGLTLDGGLSWRLPKLIGFAAAQRLVFEDPDLEAEEAQAIGLLHRVLPATEVVRMLEGILTRARMQSRMAILRNRQLLLESQGRTLLASYEAEAVIMKTSAGTQDGREGIQAFVEKRPPAFGS